MQRVRAVIAAAAMGCLLGVAVNGLGCSSEEPVNFGDGGCEAGGCQGTTSTSTVNCTVNDACPVSFTNDIYNPILLSSANCSVSGCHGPEGIGPGGFKLSNTSAAEARAALLAYELIDPMFGGPYVVPCDPEASTMLCNMRLDGGAINEHGECGTRMPLSPGGALLTVQQVETIAEWIACGAPDN